MASTSTTFIESSVTTGSVFEQEPKNSSTLSVWEIALILCGLGFIFFYVSAQLKQVILAIIGICLMGLLYFQAVVLRKKDYRAEQPMIRLIGNVLEYSTPKLSRKIALNRSVVSFASSPKSALVMMIDDGKNSLVVGRLAEPHETCHLPIYRDDFTEISSTDFEKIFFASNRFCPSA